MKKVKVLCVAYNRPIELMQICSCFLVQTNPNWELTIMYDGIIPKQIQDIMNLFGDPRIYFTHSEKRNERWGHPNRKIMLQSTDGSSEDYILLTNEDNYYVPIFVDAMLRNAKENVGIVMCDTVHSYSSYTPHISELRECGIDMGAFVVRGDIAKAVGFKHEHFSADGRYAEECGEYCRKNGLEILHVNHLLFVHN